MEGFLGRLLQPLLKTGLPLIGNVLRPLAKIVLIPLRLTAAAYATDGAIHKKMFRCATTILIISDKEINDIMKIVKSLEESGLLIKSVSKTIENEAKEQKGEFLRMLLGTLDASLLGNLLTGKGTIATSQERQQFETLATRANMSGRGTIRAGEGTIIADAGTIKAGQDF